MKTKLKFDPARLASTYDDTTMHSAFDCGCIKRGDGTHLRYCAKHNPRVGTHGRAQGGG